MTQHSARVVAPDRLLVYDNATEPDLGDDVADSRAVEYVLDRANGTATRVWDESATGAGSTLFAGSVQRLPDGSTLVGWASLPPLSSWGPALSEIDPQGEVAFELTLAEGLMTYRASKAVLVGDRWTAP
jgi:hypothetical protein